MTVGGLIKKKLQKYEYTTKIYFTTESGDIEYKVHEIEKFDRGVYIDLKEIKNEKY